MPGLKNPDDPFGFGQSFVPIAKEVGKPEPDPDPDLVPQPGKLRDPRFNRDVEADGKLRIRLGAFVRYGPTAAALNQPVELGSKWPTPEMRASAPRDPRTSPVPSLSVARSPAVSVRPGLPPTPWGPGQGYDAGQEYDSRPIPPHLRRPAASPAPAPAPSPTSQGSHSRSVPPHLRRSTPSISTQGSSTSKLDSRSTASINTETDAEEKKTSAKLTTRKLAALTIASRPGPGLQLMVPEAAANTVSASEASEHTTAAKKASINTTVVKKASENVSLVSANTAWYDTDSDDAISDDMVSDNTAAKNTTSMVSDDTDAHMAMRMQLEEYGLENGPRGTRQGSKMVHEYLEQSKIEATSESAKTVSPGDTYERYCKIQEMTWKQDELQNAFPIDEQSLDAMDDRKFEGLYSLVCFQHKEWFDFRSSKAQQIVKMEKELNVNKSSRYTFQDILKMDSNALDRLYDKVVSAYKYVVAEKAAAFLAAESKVLGGDSDIDPIFDNTTLSDNGHQDDDDVIVYQGRWRA